MPGDDLPFVPTHAHDPNEMFEDWEPGESLWLGHGNCVRHMFDLLPAIQGGGTYMTQFWCHDCDVMWAPAGQNRDQLVQSLLESYDWGYNGPPEACWMCGRKVPPPGEPRERMRREARFNLWLYGIEEGAS